MADQKLTDKSSISSIDDSDLIHVVDVSDTSSSAEGTSKKGLFSLFKSTLKTYFDTLYSKFEQPSTAKTTPVDADTFTLWDSASSFVAKKLNFANLKATLRTYFDTLYGNVTKVGTPVDNQIAVWTGDGTLEGVSGVTWDGTNLTLLADSKLILDGGVDGFNYILSDFSDNFGYGVSTNIYGALYGHHFIDGEDLNYLSVYTGKLYPDAMTAGTSDYDKFVVYDSTGKELKYRTSAQLLSDIGLSTINADTLDSLDSTQFLRSDVADVKTAGNLTFNDSVRIELGTSAAGGEIFYNGTDNYWKVKSGDLIIQDNSSTKFIFGRTTGDLTLELGDLRLAKTATYLYGSVTGDLQTRIHGISGTTEYIGSVDENVTSTLIGTLTDTITFRTDSTTAMYINSSQNVGIGSTTPNARLEVYNGQANGTGFTRAIKVAAGVTDGDGGFIEFGVSGTDGYGVQVGAIRTGSGLGDFIVKTGGNSQVERFRIANGGNVGIGTSSPNAELDVNGDIEATGNITANSVNGIYRKKVSLSSAQILALNTTPIEAIAAPGAGKVIVIHQMTAKLTYNTATYGGANSAISLVDSSLHSLASCTILASTSDTIRRATLDGDKVIDENSAIDLYVSLGDPTTGDSPVDVYITYEIIEL